MKKTPIQIISALLSAFITGLNTHREDEETIANLKAERDAAKAELQIHLEGEDGLPNLLEQIDVALNTAVAAKVPTEDQVAAVEAIDSATIETPTPQGPVETETEPE